MARSRHESSQSRMANMVSYSTTVCIPTNLKNIKYLPELIESINNQTLLPQEIIIVINGTSRSKDDLEEILKDLRKKLKDKSNYRFIFSEIPGLSRARNVGIRECKSEIILFGDDDDVWHPNKIEKIVNTIKKNGKCLVKHAHNELHLNVKKSVPAKYKLTPTLFLVGIGNLAGGGSSLSGSIEIFNTIRFNEKMQSCEDWYFCIRALLSNCKIINIQDELVSYRDQPNRMTRNFSKMYRYETYIRFKIAKEILFFTFGLLIGFLKSSIRFIFFDSYKSFIKTKR